MSDRYNAHVQLSKACNSCVFELKFNKTGKCVPSHMRDCSRTHVRLVLFVLKTHDSSFFGEEYS